MTREAVTFAHDALLTPAEVVEYLRVNKDTVYGMLNDRTLPSIRIGQQFRVPFWGLLQWVAQQAHAPYPERVESPASQPPRH